jgi:uncharacterized repeat protein (TIGR02543 family)
MARKFFSLVALLTVMVSPISTLVLFQTNSYSTIRFQTNGGSTVQPLRQIEGSYFERPQPTKEGYSFINWYIDSNLNKLFESNFIPKQDLTLYARWNINQYTITFQSNGGSTVNSITKDFGASITSPTTPTRQGHTFTGWFIDTELTNRYSFVTMPSNNLQLFAGWLSGDGSLQTPFQLNKSSDFDLVKNHPNSNFILSNNIELPINFSTIPTFSGTIDGKGYSLKIKNTPFINDIALSANIFDLNVLIDLTPNQNIYFNHSQYGFFASINNGNIENISISYTNSTITLNPSSANDSHYLGFVGKNLGNINQIELIDGSLIVKRTTKNYYFGPLVGWNEGTIENVTNTNVSVNAESIDLGGIVGYSNGTLRNITNRANHSNQASFYSSDWKTYTGGIASSISGVSENLANYGNLTVLSSTDQVNLGGVAGSIDSDEALTVVGLTNYGTLRGYNPNDSHPGIVITLIGGVCRFLGDQVTLLRSTNQGMILNISTSNTQKNSNSIIGGLVSLNEGKIIESYNAGNLTIGDKKTSELGGLVGRNYGTIQRSFNLGNLTSLNTSSSSYVGGTIGSMEGGILQDVYQRGAISLENQSSNLSSVAGGLVGLISEETISASIINGYAAGLMSGNSRNWFGGIVGNSPNGTYSIQNTHFLKVNTIAYGLAVSQSDVGTTQYTNLNNMFYLAFTLGIRWVNVSNELPKLVWENS